MKHLYPLLLSLISLLPVMSIAQGNKFDGISNKRLHSQARKYTNIGEYMDARERYLELVNRDSTNYKYNYELALNYAVHTSDRKALALPYLERAGRYFQGKDTIAEIHYLLGESYFLNNRFEDAIREYSNFKTHIKNTDNGQELFLDVNYRIAQAYHGRAYRIAGDKRLRVENLGSNVNSRDADYAPVVTDDDGILMFTSRRANGGKKDERDEKYFEDMYIARRSDDDDFGPAEKFKVSDRYIGLVENTPGQHDAVVSLAHDESRLFTYHDDKLHMAEKKSDGTWSGPFPLGETINDKGTYNPSASITLDGKTLYFSSERKGGMGGLDIYRSVKKDDGTWGAPENLGAAVNTQMNEDAPVISEDGKTLYFSSKGHESGGGYDIFKSTLENGVFTKPVNLGSPINSTADDIYYIPAKGMREAYFSSSRHDEGLGDMDLYRVTYKDKPAFKKCQEVAFADRQTGSIIDFNIPERVVVGKAFTVDAGSSEIKGYKPVGYFWKFEKGVYAEGKTASHSFGLPGTMNVKYEFIGTDPSGEYHSFCIVKPVQVVSEDTAAAVATITGKKGDVKTPEGGKPGGKTAEEKAAILASLKSKPTVIYFNYNESNLKAEESSGLKALSSQLREVPGAKIRIRGYADARGRDEYNKSLSARRAQAARQYLTKNGVKPADIVEVSGLGETNLLNNCDDNTTCTEAEHQVNRRVEIIVE